MELVLYTQSDSLETYLRANLQSNFSRRDRLPEKVSADALHLLHISSITPDSLNWVRQAASQGGIIAICADRPDLREMLACVQAGAKAYANSYMQAGLYQQMTGLLQSGQSWFPPQMLEQTFTLAQAALNVKGSAAGLDQLTERENEVARAVAEGMSNKQIADHCDISERTVKAHLTNIFKKLDIKDRVALVLRVK